MINQPFISVIIPCRNEEEFLAGCLDSILVQDYPKDRLEVLLADGMSTDKTIDVLKTYMGKYSCIRYMENPKKIASVGLNVMIHQARGGIIIRMDAHNKYSQDYVSKCVRYLQEYNVDNVGGILITLPGAETLQAMAIASALSNCFGVGNAFFRIGSKEPRYVDTVPFGCYKKEIFDKIGLFDEDAWRGEDDEFNARLIKSGGKILLMPDIVSYYYARKTYRDLWRMYYQYGYFKPLTAIKQKGVFTFRQLVPGIFVGLLLILGLMGFLNKYAFLLFLVEVMAYTVANFIFSFLVAVKNKIALLPYLVVAFAVLHLSYGIGYLKGILDFMVFNKHLRGKIKEMPITR